jgi:hypothetical protein
VPVRRIEAAGVNEAHGLRETCGAKCGKVVNSGQENSAAGGRRDGVVDELECVVCGVGCVGKKDGFAGGLGLREEEGVALGSELRRSEDIDGVWINIALGEGTEGFESFVDVGFTSFEGSGMATGEAAVAVTIRARIDVKECILLAVGWM